MAELKTKITLEDDFSDKLSDIAQKGQDMSESLSKAGDSADSAFSTLSDRAAEAAGNISDSFSKIQSDSESMADTADGINSYSEAVENAADKTDYWGYSEQERMEAMEEASAQLKEMQSAVSEAGSEQENYAEILKQASEAVSELTSMEDVSAESKRELRSALQEATEAYEQQQSAIENASQSMETFKTAIDSGINSVEDLINEESRAAEGMEGLEDSNARAESAFNGLNGTINDTIKDLNDLNGAADETSESMSDAGSTGSDAFGMIESALAGLGITMLIKEITQSVIEMTEAFSEAESTIVQETGATGEALESLSDSMMTAYAASKTGSLEDTATVAGEINTRLGYTNETLSETTELFLDFSSAAGISTSSSVRTLTQLMNQWGVEASDMESLMDRLTVAGQSSGVSIDTLSSELINQKGILDQLGYSLDESIALFSNFELTGTNTSQVMMGLRSALSSGAISSVEDLNQVIDNLNTGVMTTQDAAEMFGTRAGVAIANAAKTGAFAIDDLSAALEGSNGSMEETATAAQTMSQKWEQASNNIKAAFTSALSPTIEDISSKFSDLANSFGDFLNENQTATVIISALGAGLGVMAVAIGGVSVAVKVLIPLMQSLNTAIAPIAAISAAVAGISAIVGIISNESKKAYEEIDQTTVATREQADEMEALEGTYDEMCAEYGALSYEAQSVRAEMDSLSDSIENNGRSYGQLKQDMDDCISSYEDSWQEYQESIDAISSNETHVTALATTLERLASQTGTSASSQEVMKSIIDELNESVEGLNLSYEDVINNSDEAITDVKELIQQQVAQDKYNAALEEYYNLISDSSEAEESLDGLRESLKQTEDDYQYYLDMADEAGNSFNIPDMFKYDNKRSAAAKEYDEINGKIEEGSEKYSEMQDRIKELEEELGIATYDEMGFKEAIEESGDASEVAAYAYDQVSASVQSAADAYEKSYITLLESFQGQFGLFDEATANADATLENANAALDSQIEYWETYKSNIETISGITADELGVAQEDFDSFMTYLQDGSADAVGLSTDVAKQIKDGNLDALTDTIEKHAQVEQLQEEAAAADADWVSGLDDELREAVQNMEQTIDDMDLSDEANAAAKDMMDSYIEQIRNAGAEAATAAQKVATNVSNALSGVKVSASNITSGVSGGVAINSPDITKNNGVPSNYNGTTYSTGTFLAGERGHELIVSGYASGTLDSDNLYMAGENGPELIVGKPGSTVFPTSETDRIIESLETEKSPLSVTMESGNSDTDNGGSSEKRIVLEIDGKGAIEVGGSQADKQAVLDVLTDNIRPVLLNILEQEIYEEGDYSYEY